jgi:hypothetical protein
MAGPPQTKGPAPNVSGGKNNGSYFAFVSNGAFEAFEAISGPDGPGYHLPPFGLVLNDRPPQR